MPVVGGTDERIRPASFPHDDDGGGGDLDALRRRRPRRPRDDVDVDGHCCSSYRRFAEESPLRRSYHHQQSLVVAAAAPRNNQGRGSYRSVCRVRDDDDDVDVEEAHDDEDDCNNDGDGNVDVVEEATSTMAHGCSCYGEDFYHLNASASCDQIARCGCGMPLDFPPASIRYGQLVDEEGNNAPSSASTSSGSTTTKMLVPLLLGDISHHVGNDNDNDNGDDDDDVAYLLQGGNKKAPLLHQGGFATVVPCQILRRSCNDNMANGVVGSSMNGGVADTGVAANADAKERTAPKTKEEEEVHDEPQAGALIESPGTTMTTAPTVNPKVEWELTPHAAVIKMVKRRRIAVENDDDLMQPDPLDEVAATYHVSRYVAPPLQLSSSSSSTNKGGEEEERRHNPKSRVVRLIDALLDYSHVYLVLPRLGHDLHKIVSSCGPLRERTARTYFRQILEGVCQLHCAGVVHMDLSLENVLLDDDGECVIIDLGGAVLVPLQSEKEDEEEGGPSSSQQSKSGEEETTTTALTEKDRCVPSSDDDGLDEKKEKIKTRIRVSGRNDVGEEEKTPLPRLRQLLAPTPLVGKMQYLPPEVVPHPEPGRTRSPFDPFAVDLWSIAIMLFIMLTGREPWDVASTANFRYKMVQRGGITALLRAWEVESGVSRECAKLLTAMTRDDPADRLNLKQVRNHPWVVGGEE